MSGKRVEIGAKPQANPGSLDDWINPAKPKRRETVRMTFNIEKTLHKRIRIACLERGVPMARVMQEILEEKFGEDQ